MKITNYNTHLKHNISEEEMWALYYKVKVKVRVLRFPRLHNFISISHVLEFRDVGSYGFICVFGQCSR